MAGTKEKKNIFWKTGRFFRQVWAELGKVVWPNKQQTVTFTLIVISVVVLLGAAIWIVDQILNQILKLLIS